MSAIRTDFGTGGSGLVPNGSSTPTLAQALRDVADDFAGLKPATVATGNAAATAVADVSATAAADISAVATADVGETYGVADGFVTGAPTTPSSQAVDPGGETSWHVNISAGYVFCNAVGWYSAAQVDFDVSTGAKIMDIGQAMYAWLVVHEAGGVVAMHVVLGTAAALGVETIPDDAAITASVGHARWTKLALCHASRTADAVVATTEDPSLMKKWGGAGTTLINELKTRAGEARTLANELKNDLGEARALANDLKAKYNAAVTLLNECKTRLNAPAAYTIKTTKA